MDKKLERLILEKLKTEVLKRDNELRSHSEDSDIKEATKEALAEMTSLSKSEVDDIARQITNEVLNKSKRKKKIITWFIVILSFSATILAYKYYQHKNRLYIVEDFISNETGWDEYENYEYKRTMKEGQYLLDNGLKDWCAWDFVPIDFPENFSIETSSKWQKGEFGSYGIVLLQSTDNYYYFEVRADGAALVNHKVNKEWTSLDSWTSGIIKEPQKKAIYQRVEIYGNKYKYFINDLFFKEGTLQINSFRKAGLMVCQKQVIAYDYFKIKNLDTDEILLDEIFEETKARWEPKELIQKRCFFENGSYILEHGESDKCFWSTRPYDLPQNYKITLTTKWLKGEHEEYELVLKQDANNFISIQLCGDGRARYVCYVNGEYNKIPNFRNTEALSNGTNSNNQTIEVYGNDFKYFVNDQFIDKWNLNNLTITELGVRICGKQKVAFEKIVIEGI